MTRERHDEARMRLYAWLVKNGPARRPKAISAQTGFTEIELVRAAEALIACGAVEWRPDGALGAREGVDPLSREDHLDCYPTCRCFEADSIQDDDGPAMMSGWLDRALRPMEDLRAGAAEGWIDIEVGEEPCKPPNACATHGRCWSHSHWAGQDA